MEQHRLDRILTFDPDFDHVPGIVRVSGSRAQVGRHITLVNSLAADWAGFTESIPSADYADYTDSHNVEGHTGPS